MVIILVKEVKLVVAMGDLDFKIKNVAFKVKVLNMYGTFDRIANKSMEDLSYPYSHCDLLDNDAPPSSLMDSTTSPKVKTTKGEGVGAHSPVRITSKVEGCAGVLGWGLGRLTSNSITHTNLHK